MAGLLDFLNTDQGRMGLGLLAAAGPRTDGAGFGQRMQEGMGSFDAYKQNALKQKMLQAQMQEYEQASQDKAQTRQQAQLLRDLSAKFATPEKQRIAPLMGDAETGIMPSAGRDAEPAGYDYAGFAGAMAAIDPVQSLKIKEMLKKEGPKFSTAPQYDQQGNAFILAENGEMKYLNGVKARDKLEEVRLGDKVAFRSPYSTEMQGGMPIGQSPDGKASDALGWANNALTRDRDAATNSRATERLAFDKAGGVAGTKPVKQGPMSTVLQKELLESDDISQSSGAVVDLLTKAKGVNDKAYSGYGAKTRAVLASNLPGQYEGADATIDLDNMMTGQALESLKSVFGGMPTEGERKILLEMQASADKTPQQRAAIMDRAIAAAQRRGEFAGKKAGAIRGGTYLTEGVDQTPADVSQKPADTAKLSPAANLMPSLPTANASNKGRKIRDTTTGKVLISNGMTWMEAQ